MSVELSDTNGSLGQAATNSGFADVREVVESSSYKELKAFFDNGYTKQPKIVADQLAKLSKNQRNEVKSTMINIAQQIHKAKDFVVVEV